MKIVYISDSVIPSRTANSIHVMKMCQAFAENGHNIWLISKKTEHGIENGIENIFEFYSVDNCFRLIRIICLDPKKSRLLNLVSVFLYSLAAIGKTVKIKPDIVYGRNVFGCMAAALLGYRTFFESHSPVWHSILESIAFNILRKNKYFERLIVISSSLKDMYIKSLHLCRNKIKVAHDGSDIVKKNATSNRWPGRQDVLQVGYVGHLYKGKGVEVIEAVAPEMPEVDFHIIGGMKDDITFWKNRINRSNVIFHGFIPQNKISEKINSIDICLLPNQKKVSPYTINDMNTINISNYTSPIKLFDYMAHRKAIIASDLPVLREILNDQTAIFVSSNDMAGWKAAINLLKDKSLRTKIGESAYKEFIAKYTWKNRAKQVLL